MKCTKCKGDGRQLQNGTWGLCERCTVTYEQGRKRATGIEPEPIPVPVPTLESIMAAGFDEHAATAILMWEEAKSNNDGAPPAPIAATPVPAVTNILSVPVKTLIGRSAKPKSGGPDMIITNDLGGDELVCEWTVTSPEGVAGKESRVFQAASLNIEG